MAPAGARAPWGQVRIGLWLERRGVPGAAPLRRSASWSAAVGEADVVDGAVGSVEHVTAFVFHDAPAAFVDDVVVPLAQSRFLYVSEAAPESPDEVGDGLPEELHPASARAAAPATAISGSHRFVD